MVVVLTSTEHCTQLLCKTLPPQWVQCSCSLASVYPKCLTYCVYPNACVLYLPSFCRSKVNYVTGANYNALPSMHETKAVAHMHNPHWHAISKHLIGLAKQIGDAVCCKMLQMLLWCLSSDIKQGDTLWSCLMLSVCFQPLDRTHDNQGISKQPPIRKMTCMHTILA